MPARPRRVAGMTDRQGIGRDGAVSGRSAGFTLVELIVVVAMAAILLAVGVPAMQDMAGDNRLVAAANDLVAQLNLARSEAIKRRNGRTVVCSTADPTATTPTCSGSTDWNTGSVVFWTEDLDADGTLDAGEDVDGDGAIDVVVLRAGPAPAGVEVNSDAGAVRFGAEGTLVSAAAVFGVCDGRGADRGRQVTVTLVGRPQVATPATDCTP